MTMAVSLAFVGFALAFGALSYFDPGTSGLRCIYDAKLQTPLFTGFLTLGGFLLTLKTFVLIQLKKELYDTDYYKAEIDKKRALKADLTLYGGLDRLSKLLVLSVFAALLTSVSQLSVGFIESKFAAAFCISLAVGTLALVFQSWFHIRQNLIYWFALLNEKDKSR